jgi:hypothetical protein
MQGQDTQKTNVVSLFNSRQKGELDHAAAFGDAHGDAPISEESFQDIMERNLKNKERQAKERANANKSVLRSYRIKN